MKKRKRAKGPGPNANARQLYEAEIRGMDKVMVYALTALHDKMGFELEDLSSFIGWIGRVADSVSRGYVTYEDMRKTLIYELGLKWGDR